MYQLTDADKVAAKRGYVGTLLIKYLFNADKTAYPVWGETHCGETLL